MTWRTWWTWIENDRIFVGPLVRHTLGFPFCQRLTKCQNDIVVANMVADNKILQCSNLVRDLVTGLVNWAQTFYIINSFLM